MRVTPAVRRAGLAVLLGVAVATCRDDPTGPGRGFRASLALAPVFPAQVANLAAFGLAVDSLRVVVVRPPSDTVADTTVAFAADQDSLALALSLPLEQSPDTFTVVMELRGGGFVLFTGSAPAHLSAGSNAPIEITNFVYSGPGAAVTTLQVTPADSVIRFGDSLRFQVDAQASGVPVTQFYVSWSSSNATLAPINAHGVMYAPAQRALVQVTATTPTGITATVPVTFVPVPTQVAAVPPVPQNVPALAPIGPLRVRVLAGDGLGVKGVPVTFAAVSGGGSVSSLLVATDSAGFAETNAVSGPTGTSVYSASVAGLTPVTFNVIVVGQVGTQLAFTFPPTGAIEDQPFGVAVEVRDAGGAVVAAATDPITIALGANPGGATLGGTLTVNAVQGIALFADLTIDQVGSGYTLVATAPALTSATTPPFDVFAGFTGRMWTNAAGGNWSDPANWSDNLVPVAGDTVYVALDGDYTVTLDVNVSVSVLFLGGASGTQTLTGLARTLQVDGFLSIGATGVLDLTNSTVGGPAGTVLNSGAVRLQSTNVTGSLFNSTGASLLVRGATSITDALVNATGAVTRIEGDPFCCVATLTVGDVSNAGQLELTAINSGGTSAALDGLGEIANLPGGTITAAAGTGGARTINGQLNNSGVLQLEQDVLLNGPGAQHQNFGTIQLAGGNLSINQSGTSPTFYNEGSIVVGLGRTLAVTGGTFDYGNPAPGGLAGLGTVSMNAVVLSLGTSLDHDTLSLALVNSQVIGPGTLTNALGRTLTIQQTAINVPFVNQGTLVARGASSLGSSVTAPASSIIRLQADPQCCISALTVASGFTNDGLIELTAINSGGSTSILAVTSGTLVNATGGTIAAIPATGGGRFLQAQLSNDGTLLVAQDLTLDKVEADHLNSGLIQLTTGNLSLVQSGSTPTIATPGSIVVGAGRTLSVSGGTFQYTSATPGGLAGLGVMDFSGTTVALVQGFTHDTLSVSFVNSTISGPGTLATAAGRTMTMQQTAINAPFVNAGTLVTRGASSINGALTTATGSTIQLQGDPTCCVSSLTVPSGLTNNGLIELTAIGSGGTTAQLDVLSGFLVNAAGATIAARAGTGGVRNLQAALNNQGTLLVETDVSLGAASADHVNTGEILVTGGTLIVPQNGTTPTFTTSGSVVVGAGRSLQVSGGAFNYSGGVLGGLGSVTFLGAAVNLTPALSNDTLSLSFTNSTVSGPGTLTNAAGRSLNIQQTALNLPFVNQGFLVARGASSLGGSVTAAAGGTIRIEADPTCCIAALSVASPFTNDGLIELTAINSGGSNASLDVAGGLTNGPAGTLAIQPGTGGSRSLGAQLTNNGTLSVATNVTLGAADAAHVNTGTINVTAGTLAFALSGATPSVTNQGVVTVGTGATVLTTGGTFVNATTGTLAGSGTVDVLGTTFTNDGTVAPGGSPGVLTFNGTFSMSASAVLGIEIGGTVAGTEYDQVVVGGTGSLAGTLNVTLINGFTPTIGQAFTVVSGGSILGLPTSLNLPSVAGAIWLPSLGAAGLQLSVVSASALLPVTWTGGGGDGLWGNGLNWSTLAPPGAGDSAIINPLGPVTVTVNTNATAAFLDIGTVAGTGTKTLALASPTLTLTAGGIVGGDGVVNVSGGMLTGGGTLQVNGAFNWTGGQVAGAGVVQVNAAGALTLSGTGTKSLNSRTIQTAGPVTWSGTGAIGSGGGALLRVQTGGTFAVNGDASFTHNLGGSPPRVIVEPGGTLVRSIGTGIANLSVAVDNGGAVQVNTGTLELRSGGVHAGSFAISTGGQLDFPAGTHTFADGAQFTGAGLARVIGATLSVDPIVSVPINRLHLQSGSLLGAGEFLVQDSLVWTAGAQGGAGTTTVNSGADLVINGNVSFNGRLVTNAGVVTWLAGNISSGNGARLLNQSGGLVDLRADALWSHNLGGAPPQLDNAAGGVVQRSVGAGLADVRALLGNSGTVQVSTGTLGLNGGGSSSGAFTVAAAELAFGGTHALTPGSSVSAAGTVSVGSGTTTIGGTLDVTGQMLVTAGTLAFDAPDTARITNLALQGGTLSGSGVVLVRGAANWTGGTLGGSGVLRIPTGVTLNVTGPVSFSARAIANAGQVLWVSGQISSGLGAFLGNESGALFDIQGAAAWVHNLGGTLPLVNNAAGAVVRRSTSTGVATLHVPLTNAGTLDVQTGTLVLQAGASTSGTQAMSAGATLQYGGIGHSWATGAAFTGLGRVVVPAGATVLVDAVAPDTVDARWIELSGGVIGGTGVLQMGDSLVWTSGQLNDAGVVRIPAGAQLLIRGTATKQLQAHTIANAGLVSWTGTGPISSGNNAALVNESGANFQLESDADWFYNLGGVIPHIDNLPGGLVKRGSATSAITVAAAFNNDGTLDLQTGSVTFTGGGASKGMFLLTAPGTAGFGGGTHVLDAGSAVTGTGSFHVSAGNVTVLGVYNPTGITRISAGAIAFDGSQPADVTTLDLSGGTLGGLGLVNLHGAGTWTGGTMTGTGQLAVFAAASLTIDGTATKTFRERTILNAGFVSWKGTGPISSGLGAVFTNQVGATFEANADAAWVHNQGGVAPTVNNAGSLKRNAATGTASIAAAVNNSGTVDQSTGTLALTGGGSSTGLYAVAPGSVLDFGGGTHTLSGPTSRVSGAGSVTFTSGAVTVSSSAPNAYDITGTTLIDGATATFDTPDTTRFTTLQLRNGSLAGTAHMVVRGSGLWTGGTLAAPPALPAAVFLRVPQGASFTIGGTATKQFTKRTILVNANASAGWTGGNVLAASGATLDVQPDAVFNVSAVGAWSSGAPQPFIHIRDRAFMNVTTAGTTTVAAGLVFNNQGTLDIATGATLKVGADLNQLAGSTLQGRGVLDVVGNTKVVNQGTTRPGTSPGILSILGNWPQSTGSTFAVDVIGTGQGTGFDLLQVSGTITTGGGTTGSGGTLHLFGPGTTFRPPAGTYTILTFGSRAGVTFDNIAVFAGLAVPSQIIYTTTSLQLVW